MGRTKTADGFSAAVTALVRSGSELLASLRALRRREEKRKARRRALAIGVGVPAALGAVAAGGFTLFRWYQKQKTEARTGSRPVEGAPTATGRSPERDEGAAAPPAEHAQPVEGERAGPERSGPADLDMTGPAH